MAGCRPLSEVEVFQVLGALKNERDKLLFILGIRTGFRISELLALRVSDVYRDGAALPKVKVLKRYIKEKKGSREIPLHPQAQAMINLYVKTLRGPDLFPSRMGGTITRYTAHTMLKDGFKRAGLKGALATHSMRKSFAKKIYAALGHDLVSLRDALGHSNVSTTMDYVTPNQSAIDRAVME